MQKHKGYGRLMVKNNQKGFTVFEVVLVVIALVAIGFAGYFAHQSRQDKTDYSINAPIKSKAVKSSGDQTSSQRYFTITEWGVRAPYSGFDTLTYKLGDNLATVMSQDLSEKYSGCQDYGAGLIRRLLPSEGAYPDGSGPSVEQYAAQNPGMFTHVGNYYYEFQHDSAACVDNSGEAQNQANSVVKSLVAQFEPVK